MELLEGLKTRRSVRLYDTTKKIPHEDIEKILEAVSYSPSAHNKQPWEFLVIEDKETLASLRSIQPWTSLSFITEQLPQKVKMSKSNLPLHFRFRRKIVRISVEKKRKPVRTNK